MEYRTLSGVEFYPARLIQLLPPLQYAFWQEIRSKGRGIYYWNAMKQNYKSKSFLYCFPVATTIYTRCGVFNNINVRSWLSQHLNEQKRHKFYVSGRNPNYSCSYKLRSIWTERKLLHQMRKKILLGMKFAEAAKLLV